MLLLGSFDTTAASLQSFVLLMCQHPDIVAKGSAHVKEVLGNQSHDVSLSHEQMRELHYIDQVNIVHLLVVRAVEISSRRYCTKALALIHSFLRESRNILLFMLPVTFVFMLPLCTEQLREVILMVDDTSINEKVQPHVSVPVVSIYC